MKKLTYILVIFTAILCCFLTFNNKNNSNLVAKAEEEIDDKEKEKLNILTINKELYTMTCDLVGDRHNVEYILSEDRDININEVNIENTIIDNILKKDLFIYSGFYNGDFVNRVISLSADSNLRIINASRGIRAIDTASMDDKNENPYYLLGFSEYKIALYNIKIALQEIDMENREYYENNYNNIIEELDKSLKLVKEQIDEYDNFEIYTNTDKFDYIFRDLNINVNKVNLSNKEGEANKEIEIDSKKNNIFIYDINSNSKENIVEETSNKFIYLGLSAIENDDVIIDNANKIIEVIKNNDNNG